MYATRSVNISELNVSICFSTETALSKNNEGNVKSFPVVQVLGLVAATARNSVVLSTMLSVRTQVRLTDLTPRVWIR